MASKSLGASSSIVANTTPKRPMSTETSSTKPRQAPNFSEQIFVTIFVGTSLQKFVVHKNALCHYSQFFLKAFDVKSNFVEGQTQEMTLDDVDIDLFGILVNWCYTQRLEHVEGNLTIVEMGKLWSLGDRFIMPISQNCAMRGIADRQTVIGSTLQIRYKDYQEFIEYAYGESRHDTPLKRAATARCLAIMTGKDRTAAKGEGDDLVKFFFGEGPAQDVLRELLQYFKTEISGRNLRSSIRGPLRVQENS